MRYTPPPSAEDRAGRDDAVPEGLIQGGGQQDPGGHQQGKAGQEDVWPGGLECDLVSGRKYKCMTGYIDIYVLKLDDL